MMEDTGVIDTATDKLLNGSDGNDPMVSGFEYQTVYNDNSSSFIHLVSNNSGGDEALYNYASVVYPTNSPVGSDYEDEAAGAFPAYQEYQEYQIGEQPLVQLPYDFSGLQFSQLSEDPRVWNSQDAFLEQVGFKLYMFIPAGLAGILLGVFLWIVAMIVLRAYGVIKRAVLRKFQNSNKVDLEMGSPCLERKCNVRDIDSADRKIKPTINNSNNKKTRSSPGDLFTDQFKTKDCIVVDDNKNLVEVKHPSKSTQSSPISMSSGIGVSEKDSDDEEDSEASGKEFTESWDSIIRSNANSSQQKKNTSCKVPENAHEELEEDKEKHS